MAGQKTQVEQPEDRGGNVGDRSGHRLQQQPGADRGARQGQHGSRQRFGPAALNSRPLGGEQQKLAGHQGCLGGGADPFELSHAEELQQAQMHDHTDPEREPPAPQQNHQGSEAADGQATAKTLAQALGGTH